MTKYDVLMVAERITISLDKELAEALRQAAAADNVNVSAWVAMSLQHSLRTRGLAAVIADWEAEHGAFTEAELKQARRRLAG
jgi:hypothetical protein